MNLKEYLKDEIDFKEAELDLVRPTQEFVENRELTNLIIKQKEEYFEGQIYTLKKILYQFGYTKKDIEILDVEEEHIGDCQFCHVCTYASKYYSEEGFICENCFDKLG